MHSIHSLVCTWDQEMWCTSTRFIPVGEPSALQRYSLHLCTVGALCIRCILLTVHLIHSAPTVHEMVRRWGGEEKVKRCASTATLIFSIPPHHLGCTCGAHSPVLHTFHYLYTVGVSGERSGMGCISLHLCNTPQGTAGVKKMHPLPLGYT